MDNDAAKGCGVIICLTVLLSLVIMCGFVGIDATYSTGHRDGYMQKFSRKGFVFHSWEGELALPGLVRQGDKLTGAFEFSVTDPAVITELNDIGPDELVRLHYRQVMKNAHFFYSTSYRITSVERLKRNKNGKSSNSRHVMPPAD